MDIKMCVSGVGSSQKATQTCTMRPAMNIHQFQTKVEEILVVDRCVTVQDIAQLIGDISKTTMDKILTKRVRLHHDKAHPHVSCTTTDLIAKFRWEIVDHPIQP